jgi:hypothetical protein
MHHLTAQSFGYQRRHDDVGIEDDGHETILKTSSSV